MRSPAIHQVIEALQPGRSGSRDALHMMKLRDTPQFRLDGIVRGLVRRTRFCGAAR